MDENILIIIVDSFFGSEQIMESVRDLYEKESILNPNISINVSDLNQVGTKKVQNLIPDHTFKLTENDAIVFRGFPLDQKEVLFKNALDHLVLEGVAATSVIEVKASHQEILDIIKV